MKVQYSRRALGELDGIYARIAKDSPRAAREQRNLIGGALKRLRRSPSLGKQTDVAAIRKLVIGKGRYAAYYSIEKNFIVIVRILRTRQNQ